MSKKVFKVGDRVRTLSNVAFASTQDILGTVRVIEESGTIYYGVEFDKNIGGHDMLEHSKPEYKKGHCYYVSGEDLVKAENSSIHITADGNKTIAVMKDGKQEVGRGVATCNPTDEFDFKTGVKLAMGRLLGEEIKGDYVIGVREVSRKAEVGEWIKFKGNAGNGKLLNKIGQVLEIGNCVFRVEHEKAWSHSSESKKGFEITNFSFNPEYVVLENYNPEKTEPVESTKLTEQADEYLSFKKVKRQAKVGEYMLIVNAENVPGDDYKNGDIVKCISRDGHHERYAEGMLGGRLRVLYSDEYVVLEGYQVPKTFETTYTQSEVLELVKKELEGRN